MQLIQFPSHCVAHNKPYTHICLIPICACETRLCEDCAAKHNRNFKDSDSLKIDSYVGKLCIELDIAHKQYSFLQDTRKNYLTNGMTVYEAANEVRIVENVMKVFAEEEKRAVEKMNKFKAAHEQMGVKLPEYQSKSHQPYMNELADKNLYEVAFRNFSQEGMKRFSSRIQGSVRALNRCKQFLTVVEKYGTTKDQFCNFAFEPIFQANLNELLKNHQILPTRALQFKHNSERNLPVNELRCANKEEKKCESPSENQKISSPVSMNNIAPPRKRSHTIFGKKK